MLLWGDSGKISSLIDICLTFSGWAHEKLIIASNQETQWQGNGCERDFYNLKNL